MSLFFSVYLRKTTTYQEPTNMKRTVTYALIVFLLAIAGVADGQSSRTGFVPHEFPLLDWADIVTEQPEGYVVDENGDVHLYSAEALAWLCSVSNGCHGTWHESFEGKTITLEVDVDMSAALWFPICIDSEFKGTFNGKNHIIDGLQLLRDDSYYTGFFGYLRDATLSNIVIRNGYYEGEGYGNGFLASQADGSSIDHCFVECEMYGGQCAPFVYANNDTNITNSMVYCNFLHFDYDDYHSTCGGIFVGFTDGYMATPQIINCSAIIKKMDWSGDCAFVGEHNVGIIKNCYAHIGEIMNCPEFPDPLSRNGITKDNWLSGEIINSYYNSPLRTRNSEGDLIELPLNDEPCQFNYGFVSDAVSFDRDVFGSWKLAQPITFDLNSGAITTNILLDALNYKIDDLNDDNLLYWCDSVMGFDNQQLPVLCDFVITTIGENETNNGQVLLYPNPIQNKVSVKIESPVESESYNFELVDINGCIVMRKTAYGNNVTLDMDNLSPGIYVLSVKGNSFLHRQTVIKTE